MTTWQERSAEETGLRTAAQQLSAELAGTPEPNTELDEETRLWLRISRYVDLVTEFSASDDWSLLTPALAQRWVAPANQVSENLVLYRQAIEGGLPPEHEGATSTTFLVRASEVIDRFIDAAGWPILIPRGLPEDSGALQESITSLLQQWRDGVEGALGRLNEKSNEATTGIDAHVSDMRSSLDEINAAAVARQEELAAQLTALKESLGETETRNDSLVNGLQTRFDAAEVERTKAVDAEVAGFKEKVNEELEIARKAFSADAERHRLSAKETLDHLDSVRERVDSLAGLIAETGLARGYEIDADEEQSAANFWRWGAILAIILALAWSAGAFWISDMDGDFNRDEFLGRLPGAALLAAGATYAARQSGEHRSRERAARQLQRQLQSFALYLEPLPDDKQESVRLLLADRFFASGDGKKRRKKRGDNSDDDESAHSVSVIEGLLQIIRQGTDRSIE